MMDVMRAATSFGDGIPTSTWTLVHSYPCDFQVILAVVGERSRASTQIGGLAASPEYRGFFNREVDIKVGDYLSPDSGTTKYDVLVVATYDEHIEVDLRTRQQ